MGGESRLPESSISHHDLNIKMDGRIIAFVIAFAVAFGLRRWRRHGEEKRNRDKD